MKNKLKIVVAIMTVAILLMASGCAQKSYDLASDKGDAYAGTVPTISVTGEGELEVAPDTANVRFEVSGYADTAEDAQTVIGDAVSAVTTAVKNEGVEDADVQTDEYYIYQEYEYDRYGNRTENFWYHASTSVNVKVRNIDGVSDVIDAGVKAGANFTGGIWFTLEDKSIYEGEALKLAYENAFKKAGIVCEAAGKKVGEAIVITDGSTEMPETIYNDVPDAYKEPADEQAWSGSMETGNTISPGTLTITANVTVRFIME